MSLFYPQEEYLKELSNRKKGELCEECLLYRGLAKEVNKEQPKKIYRLKEDQAFSLSLELDRREKFARHPSADFLVHSVGGGGDFVDTVIAVKMTQKGMRDN